MRFGNAPPPPGTRHPPRSPRPGKAAPDAKLKRELFGSRRIPRGWLRIVGDLDRALGMLALGNPTRVSRIVVTGRLGSGGRDGLQVHGADHPVAGVLRKADARARASCRICGRRTHCPPGMPSGGGYCPQHVAAVWLLWLASKNAEPTKSSGRGLFGSAASDGGLRVPRDLVDMWLARDTAATAMAVRHALAGEATTVALDSFDAAAFLAWIKPLVPSLKRIQSEQERGLVQVQ